MDSFTEQNSLSILESFIKDVGLVSHLLDSYNWFVNFGLQELLDQEPPISIPSFGYFLKFGNVYIEKPSVMEANRSVNLLYPADARRRELYYDAPIYCDIIEKFEKEGKENSIVYNRIYIGRMPVMLNSCLCNLKDLMPEERIKVSECPNDPGGYFIINGNERVIVSNLRSAYNQITVLKQKNDKYKMLAETRSMSNETGHSVLIQCMLYADERTVAFSLPYIKEYIPAGIVLKALGFEEKEIIELLTHDSKTNKYINYIIKDSSICQTKEEALMYIGKHPKKGSQTDNEVEYAKQVVENEVLPHLGINSTPKEIGIFLSQMIKKLLATEVGLRGEDDRDNYANKRVETAGILFYEIYRNIFKKLNQKIKKQLEKKKQIPDGISIISREQDLTKWIRHCMATGNWRVSKGAKYFKSGVSQVLDRMTYCSSLSHLRRLLIQIGKQGKNSAIRQIHSSSYGMCCVTEDTLVLTPRGEKYIKDIKNGDIVITANPETLETEESPIYNYFCKEAESLLEITDEDGNVIKCTPDHPFLVQRGDKRSWVYAKDLLETDFLIRI